MEARRATVAGIPMRWLETGTGAPVVFVHGFPTSPALWRHVLPRLSGVRGLAWEMRGYGAGLGEGEGRDLAPARQAEGLLAWLEHLGVERAPFVGHGLGGAVVQIAALRRPERCAGLVLAATAAGDASPTPALGGLRALGPALERLPPGLFARLLAAWIRRGHDDAAKAAEAAAFHAELYRGRGGPAGFVRQLRALDAHEGRAATDAGPGRRVPVRLVWGAADRVQPVRVAERLARALGAPLVRIPGARHFTPEDHPDALADAVRSVRMASGDRRGGRGVYAAGVNARRGAPPRR